jgi:glycosyltransferase involved in cell wall biosynthesis
VRMEGQAQFSLVLGTVGRTHELERFLASLNAQTYRNFELVVVDQNPDDRLGPILRAYEGGFTILHLGSEKGLSRAKNLGIEAASGAVIGFPDDNCRFPPRLLQRVADFFDRHPETDGLTGRSVDELGNESNGRYDARPGAIDRFNVWRRGIAYNVFLRRDRARDVRFDTQLGPGAGTQWGAGDETDHLLRLLDAGASLYYDPDLLVVHAQPVPPYDAAAMSRAYAYGCGIGRVLNRHRYPLAFKASWVVRALGGAMLSLMVGRRPEAEYRWNTFKGRLKGLAS